MAPSDRTAELLAMVDNLERQSLARQAYRAARSAIPEAIAMRNAMDSLGGVRTLIRHVTRLSAENDAAASDPRFVERMTRLFHREDEARAHVEECARAGAAAMAALEAAHAQEIAELQAEAEKLCPNVQQPRFSLLRDV